MKAIKNKKATRTGEGQSGQFLSANVKSFFSSTFTTALSLEPVPNFSVAGIDGKTESLMPPGKKAGVVLFLSARARQTQAYADRIRALAADPAYKDVAFLALYPNADETVAAIKSEAAQRPLGIPIAKDAGNRLADHFAVTTVPAVWVVNAKGAAANGTT